MDAEYNMLTVDAEAEASDEDFEDAHESFGVEEDMFDSDAASTQTHKQQPLSKRLTSTELVGVSYNVNIHLDNDIILHVWIFIVAVYLT